MIIKVKNNLSIPQAIRDLRKKNKMTQEELGVHIERSGTTINRFENGSTQVSNEDVVKMFRVFNEEIMILIN